MNCLYLRLFKSVAVFVIVASAPPPPPDWIFIVFQGTEHLFSELIFIVQFIFFHKRRLLRLLYFTGVRSFVYFHIICVSFQSVIVDSVYLEKCFKEYCNNASNSSGLETDLGIRFMLALPRCGIWASSIKHILMQNLFLIFITI